MPDVRSNDAAKRLAHASYRYDEDFLLKVTPLLWLTLLYCVRHVLFVGLSFMPRMQDLAGLRHQVDPVLLFSNIPALFVAVAYLRRSRGQPLWLKIIWHRGVALLSLALLGDAVLLLAVHGHEISSVEKAMPIVSWLCINLLLLVYLHRSEIVRDIFADYAVAPTLVKP